MKDKAKTMSFWSQEFFFLKKKNSFFYFQLIVEEEDNDQKKKKKKKIGDKNTLVGYVMPCMPMWCLREKASRHVEPRHVRHNYMVTFIHFLFYYFRNFCVFVLYGSWGEWEKRKKNLTIEWVGDTIFKKFSAFCFVLILFIWNLRYFVI